MSEPESGERPAELVKHRRVRHGLVIVNTGEGKGKTTAALGVIFRAWGRDFRIRMFQFIKHTGARFGEHRAAAKLGIPIEGLGDGFTWLSKDMDRTAALAVEQWERCKRVIITGRYALQGLIECADLVTEMKLIKHPYEDRGIKAQQGIEF